MVRVTFFLVLAILLAAPAQAFRLGWRGTSSIGSASDTDLTTLVDDDLLQWDAVLGRWYPVSSVGLSVAVSSAVDTDLATAANRYFMRFKLSNRIWYPEAESSIDHVNLQNIGTNTHAQIDSHIADVTSNPHAVAVSSTIDADVTTAADGHFPRYKAADRKWYNVVLSYTLMGDFDTGVTASTHAARVDNPHSVTSTQVGKDVAQWDANEILGVTVDDAAKADNYVLGYDLSGTKLEYITHQGINGAGSNTHAQIDSHIADVSNPHVVTASQLDAVTTTGTQSISGPKTWNALQTYGAGITANPGGGTGNEIYGDGAGNATLSGSDNSGLGYFCLNALTSGKYNTAFGYRTLCTNQTSYGQTAIGYDALAVAVGPNGYNVAVGYEAAKMLTGGASNVAIGSQTLHAATSAYECVAIGRFALEKATSGHGNTALGTASLGQTTTGNYSVGLGQYAGFENTTESNRCYIGGFVAPASSYPLQHWWEVPVADIDLNKTQFDVRLNRNRYKFLLAQQDGSVIQTPYETQAVAPTMTSTHAVIWADASGDPQWSYNGSSTGLVTTGTPQNVSGQKTFTTSQVFNTAIVVKGHDTYASSPVTLSTTIQYVFFDISGGSIIANLPVINGALWRCKVVGWAGGNNVTLTPVGGTIDGAVSNSLALNGTNDAADVYCNGTNFWLY